MQRAEIRIDGHLDPRWADWFDGYAISYTEDGQTLLMGDVSDQASFYGLIAKLRDVGANLVSVNISLPAGQEKKSRLPTCRSK
jgi:hypothetical protein